MHHQNLCRFSLSVRPARTLRIYREPWDPYFINKYNMAYCQHTAEALDGASMHWSEAREVSVHLTKSNTAWTDRLARINIKKEFRKMRTVWSVPILSKWSQTTGLSRTRTEDMARRWGSSSHCTLVILVCYTILAIMIWREAQRGSEVCEATEIQFGPVLDSTVRWNMVWRGVKRECVMYETQ
jgi:hypothetical protein